MQHAAHGKQAKDKERRVENQPPFAADGSLLREGDMDGAFAAAEKADRRQQHQAHQDDGQQQREELAQAQLVFGIEEEVLGIAHGGGHAAKVGGDGLQADHRDQQLPPVDHLQHKNCKGDKGDEGHVIRHQHGAEERQHDQKPGDSPHRPLPGQQLLGQDLEDAHILETGYHGHQAEEEAQNPEIDVTEVGRGRRDPKR